MALTKLNTRSGITAAGLGALTSVGSSDLPAGTIVQTLVGESTTFVECNTTSFISAGLSKTITPLFANSLILISCSVQIRNDGASDKHGFWTIYANGSKIDSTYSEGFTNNSTGSLECQIPLRASHSPNSTSAQTYTVYMRTPNGTTVRTNSNVYYTNAKKSQMTLYEIKQ